ncbi:MAG: lytic transglycosylase domain-containing protein [Burkholderiales bacterium]|jgi:soluble lytic murein transglycosylase-like protein|nr:lytic transglycosylase domain-containing protein [Burkholderiales bacterium]
MVQKSRFLILVALVAACTPDVADVVEVSPEVVVAPPVEATTEESLTVGKPPAAAEKYRDTLTRYSLMIWGLNAPIATFAAQIEQESAWKPDAVSRVGAEGMAQFMPATGAWIVEMYPQLGKHEPYNPAWAMRAMVQYNQHLYRRVQRPTASECDRIAFTLRAYNGGEVRLNRERDMCAAADGCDAGVAFGGVEQYNAGRSAGNHRENTQYPRRILLTLEQKYQAWGRRSCET